MRTIAIAKKVFKELLRDKRTFALMFIAPILIMWLLNIVFSADTAENVRAGFGRRIACRRAAGGPGSRPGSAPGRPARPGRSTSGPR